jgi:integrase
MQKRLTHRSSEHMPHPKTGRIEIKDREQRGLYLRISVRGTAFRKVVGYYDRADPDCLAKARAACQRVREDAVNGRAPDTPTIRTFADLAELYVKRECNLDRLAKPGERIRMIERELRPHWDSKWLTAIERRHLTALTDVMKDERPAAANGIHKVATRIFNWAVARGHLAASPFSGMPHPAPKKSRDRVLSGDEIARLWRAWDSLDMPYREYFQVLLATAQRRGEVAGMRWDELDLEASTWTLSATRTKSDRLHIVPLSSLVVDILKSLPNCGPYVFPGRRAGAHVGGFVSLKAKADNLAGVNDYRLHDLRRTAATYMAELGTPELHIGAVLNHQRQGVTSIYNRHSYLPEKRDALEQWARHLRSIVEPAPDNLIRIA